MRLPDRLARFNRRVTNPLQMLWAGRLRAYGIVEHVGRKSGAPYRTPVSLFRTSSGGFVVPLPYGTERDWVKNLMAAGGGEVVCRRRRVTVSEPRIVSGAEAWSLLPRPVAAVYRPLKIDGVLLLTAKE
jgi:deazaflavin-dependent oxidoreductase (nitroreductase family)